jgi:hypothetical protein
MPSDSIQRFAWSCGNRSVPFADLPLLMGIVNVTPDTVGRIVNGVSLAAIAALTSLLVALGYVTWFASDDYCNWVVDRKSVV